MGCRYALSPFSAKLGSHHGYVETGPNLGTFALCRILCDAHKEKWTRAWLYIPKNCSVEVSQHPFLHVNNQFFQVHKMELWFWVRPHSPALYPQLPPANSTAASWLIGPQLAVSTLSCLRGLGNHDKALVLSGSVICLMTGKLIVQSIHNWGTQVTNEGKWIVLHSRCWF